MSVLEKARGVARHLLVVLRKKGVTLPAEHAFHAEQIAAFFEFLSEMGLTWKIRKI